MVLSAWEAENVSVLILSAAADKKKLREGEEKTIQCRKREGGEERNLQSHYCIHSKLIYFNI